MLLLSAPPEKPFRIRRCNALDCHRLFIVCSRCDCRRRYCCKSCSLNARTEQKRAARRRYRQSFQGRKNQSHRQRAYRRRKADWDRASAATAAADIVTADLDHASATGGKPNISDMKCKGVVIHLNKLAYTFDCHFAEVTKGEIKFRFWRENIIGETPLKSA